MLERLQTAAQRHLAEWTLIAVAAGFVTLLAELIMAGHTRGAQLIGVVASVAGIVLALAGLATRGKAAAWVGILMIVLSLSGLVGVAEHAEWRQERFARQERYQAFQTYQPYAARGERGAPPLLAPLSVTGLALIGAAATLAREPEKAATSEHADVNQGR